MSSVSEIEKAIAKLSRREFVELERWFESERNRLWDLQMEKDIREGRLSEAYLRLQKETPGDPDIPLNDFLDDEKLP